MDDHLTRRSSFSHELRVRRDFECAKIRKEIIYLITELRCTSCNSGSFVSLRCTVLCRKVKTNFDYTRWLVIGGTSGKGLILREKRSRKYRIKIFCLRLCFRENRLWIFARYACTLSRLVIIASCEQLKEKIIVAFHILKQSNTLESVHRNLIRRAEVCVRQNGQHFQQFL